MDKQSERRFRHTWKEIEMETLHRPSKSKLGAKAQKNIAKRILLIDPEENSALASALSAQGHAPLHCPSVQQAWNLVYPLRPDLIIVRLRDSNSAALSDLQECHVLARGAPIVLAISTPLSPFLAKLLEHETAPVLPVSSTPEALRESLHNLETAPESAALFGAAVVRAEPRLRT
jgi:DNA-binding NtrC family response regulator